MYTPPYRPPPLPHPSVILSMYTLARSVIREHVFDKNGDRMVHRVEADTTGLLYPEGHNHFIIEWNNGNIAVRGINMYQKQQTKTYQPKPKNQPTNQTTKQSKLSQPNPPKTQPTQTQSTNHPPNLLTI